MLYLNDFTLPSDIPTPPPPEVKKTSKSKKATAVVVESEPVAYNMDPIRRLAQDRRKSFKEFYLYCFGLMKKPSVTL